MSDPLPFRVPRPRPPAVGAPRCAAVACALALLAATAVAHAEDIAIRRNGCAGSVHLAARDARLSSVLDKLAKAMDFRLDFESDNDPIISIDDVLRADDVVSRLATDENFAVAHAPDPACPLQSRIVAVWVLPRAGGSRARSAATPGAVPVVAAATATAEQARREQEGIDMYMRAHGFTVSEKSPAP